ncbi:MAG: c-type cytochrome [Pseudomonadales bacterium]
MKRVYLKIVSSVIFASAFSAQASEKTDKEIAERLKPAGEVCVEGDPCATAVVASTASSGPRSGEDIYKASCTSCHDAGVAGAPKIGDADAWKPRLDNGIDTLYSNSINGVNAMPPKGLCMDCSDEEMQAVVDYMVEKSQ